MIDHNLRLERLESGVRRLRVAVVVLSTALTAALLMAAAPPKPTDLTVGRLIASTIVLEESGRRVEVRGDGVFLKHGVNESSLTANRVYLGSPKLHAELVLSEVQARIGVSTRETMPAGASLSVSSVSGQISTPKVTVVDPKDHVFLLPTGLFPPPK